MKRVNIALNGWYTGVTYADPVLEVPDDATAEEIEALADEYWEDWDWRPKTDDPDEWSLDSISPSTDEPDAVFVRDEDGNLVKKE